MYISDERLDSDQHRGRYNAPKTNEVVMVFKSSDGVPPNNRDIYIYPKQRQLSRISFLNPNCDPMTYVLFFPCGNHLNFIRHNQRTLRVESYLGLADPVNALASETGMRAGVTLILPSSFMGSPRTIEQNFQDAMSVVRDFGKPDLFLTFTCNPKWKEIKDNLFPEQKPHDRPDLVARIFDIKKKALLQDLKKNGSFGRIVADIHVIEFQKRGLPHMHLLLILAEEDKIRDPEIIHLIVSAELPDKTVDSKLHEIVKSTMIHGPCGVLNPNAPCIVDGVCTKGYPK
ncbi:helitron_like_N domain-containing protein [Trichonephila clavipes]|nr:helitron_like_N domain-containing protein [Trichonephila clavipes]